MLAKLTAENQLTLPNDITTAIGKAEYFEVKVETGKIILTPINLKKAESVRDYLATLNLNEQDIADAINWARQP